MTDVTKANPSLSEKVAAFKVIARNSLRMSLISARQSRVGDLENTLASLAGSKKKLEHALTVQNYEIGKLDTEHPDYAETKAAKEERVKGITENLEDVAKETETVTKLVTEQNEAITKIENGETKVSLDALNDLVDEMVRADAVSQVDTCSTC